MFNRNKNNDTTAVVTAAGLPYLPERYDLEQLAQWKAAVAALPQPVQLPPKPVRRHPDATDQERQAERIYRNAVQVYMQQKMFAEAEHERTDPAKIAQRNRLLRLEITSIDHHIRLLQARRADRVAAIVPVGDEQ